MKSNKYLHVFILGLGFFTILTGNLYASTGGMEESLVEKTSLLIFQLSFIILAAWIGGVWFKKMKMPSVLGEIISGVIIGPYCLGQISIPGFQHGIFPLQAHFPVSVELYCFATVASIMLLFFAGLETDIETFIQFSFAGTVVGIFGVIFSFAAGDFVGILLSQSILGFPSGPFDSIPLFLGVISTATSVGISARILSEKRKLNSPEGVTILSAAVIDDVLGIIILAIIIGMAKSGNVSWQEISFISLKAIGIWLGFTFIGLRYAEKLTAKLKQINNQATISLICFALTLFLAGIFEKSGLAMIIGAYIMGLSLSKTDLAFTIQEKLYMLQRFFVPIFFCVMGMLINLEKMMSWPILSFGMIYIVLAVLGKVIGCSIPALFLNFNMRGALRIGVGMVPRGEVALIIAGIGLSSGIINDEIFNICLIMTFVTTLITPPILDKMLDSSKPVLKKEPKIKKNVHIIKLPLPNPETAELLLMKILKAFEEEGFFVHRTEIATRIYNIRKDHISITLRCHSQEIVFDCLKRDIAFIHTLLYEVIAEVEYYMKQLQAITDKNTIGKKIINSHAGFVKGFTNNIFFPLSSIEVHLKGKTKKEILQEMIDLLIQSNQILKTKKKSILKDLQEREELLSTGMQDGIALPHAKTLAVDHLCMAIGISKKGVDFNSLDRKPSKIFILTLVPKNNPQHYLQFMADMSRFLGEKENCDKVMSCRTNFELSHLLVKNFQSDKKTKKYFK